MCGGRRAGRGCLIGLSRPGSLVLRRVGGDRAGEIAAHRFLDAPQVTAAEIVATLARRTGEACRGRRVVVAQDTTEINFAGRARRRRGLGPAGNGATPGFFVHAAVAVDVADEAVVGLIEAAVWTRRRGRVGDRHRRVLAQKESQRWLATAQAAGERAATAAQVIVVGDRESDIYALFARRPPAVELLVRAAQDRALDDGTRLFGRAAGWPVLGEAEVVIGPRRPGDKGRTARVALRAGRVAIARPSKRTNRSDPDVVELTLVEVREDQPPAGAEAVHWRLLTTLPAPDLAAAQQIARYYRLRWRIEQTFRACKSDGLGLPELQTREAGRLFKMAALALGAAVRTLQLVDARNGGARPGSDVAEPALLKAAAAIGPRLEGKTPRQRNPHPPGALPWLAWIVARLGGWNCYYKPPGPKTMRAGWDQLATMTAGYHIGITIKH
jgi:hypothetical protein